MFNQTSADSQLHFTLKTTVMWHTADMSLQLKLGFCNCVEVVFNYRTRVCVCVCPCYPDRGDMYGHVPHRHVLLTEV